MSDAFKQHLLRCILTTLLQKNVHVAVPTLPHCCYIRLKDGCHIFGASIHGGAAIPKTHTVAYKLQMCYQANALVHVLAQNHRKCHVVRLANVGE